MFLDETEVLSGARTRPTGSAHLRQAGAEVRPQDVPLRARLLFAGDPREGLLPGQGKVLEIAAGTARNLAHYPPGVTMTGSSSARRWPSSAAEHAEELGRQIDLRVGDAEALEFADESFDTVVCTFGLCTIPDDARRSARRSGYCGREADCCWPSMSAAPIRSSARSSA